MKVALITGASGGIGKETVKKFALNGYFVVGQYNNGIREIENLKGELKSLGLLDYFLPVKCDLNNSDEIETAFRIIDGNFKHIDVLINNAGMDRYKLLTDTNDDDFDNIFDVNVKSAVKFSKYALKSMIERKSGKIINVSSVWGITGASMETLYSASKSALIGLTKSLAKEVAPSGITVNCVCPGVIDTKMNDMFSVQEKAEIIESIPLKRMGRAEEIAEVIYFLSSSKADYITGQVITVDGGYIL